MIPIYVFLQGDTIGLLLLVDPESTAVSLAALAVRSSAVRVAPREGARVRFGDALVPPGTKLRDAGITPLDRVDVVFPEAA